MFCFVLLLNWKTSYSAFLQSLEIVGKVAMGMLKGSARIRKRGREEVVCKDFPKPGSHRPGSEYLNKEKLIGGLRLSHLPDWEFQKTEVGVWWKAKTASWVCDLCSVTGPGAQRPTLGLGSTVNILKFLIIFFFEVVFCI